MPSAVGAGRSGGARYRSESRGRSLSPRGRSRTRSRSRGRSESAGSVAAPKSTKVVIEKLTKNVTEDHLREIFGSFGEIKDLDVPMNRSFNTNRGTAYILYVSPSSAESAIAHMHESQLDGAVINVSIVLPRRKFSPQPPMARRGVNIDPRIPIGSRNSRGGFDSRGAGGGMGGGGRMMERERDRGGDTYRPGERNRDRSRSPRRHRTRSRSLSSRSRSRSPRRDRGRDRRDSFGGRGGRGGRDRDGSRDGRRKRSPSYSSYSSYDDRSRSPSRVRGGGGRGRR